MIKKDHCLSYCIAQILNKDINEIPHFALYEQNWIKALRLFLELYELKLICSNKNFLTEQLENCHIIGVIQHDEESTHAVLLNSKFEIIYNSNPIVDISNYKKEDLLYILIIK